MDIQGSGLSGPIPSEIGLLIRLTGLLVCSLISWCNYLLKKKRKMYIIFSYTYINFIVQGSK